MDKFPIQLVMTILALALVLVLAWIILRALSATGLTRSRTGRLKIKETLALGARERIVLIEHDEHEYLVGVSSGSINLIEKKPAKRTSTNLSSD
ncbi:MAG: flagellar biosynthetic protein FliO [Granulosicoccus sp.]|nr:flagellar biosynthetic protein FliO [Granulosicoccus sp.]